MKKVLLSVLAFLALSPSVFAGIPAFVTYSGRLTDGTGWGESAAVDLVFHLYRCQCATGEGCDNPCPAGTEEGPFWTATHPQVPVSDGYFSVRLGRCDEAGTCTDDVTQWTFPADLPDQMWVGVEFGGVELGREPVGSVPYAVQATRADIATVAESPAESLVHLLEQATATAICHAHKPASGSAMAVRFRAPFQKGQNVCNEYAPLNIGKYCHAVVATELVVDEHMQTYAHDSLSCTVGYSDWEHTYACCDDQ